MLQLLKGRLNVKIEDNFVFLNEWKIKDFFQGCLGWPSKSTEGSPTKHFHISKIKYPTHVDTTSRW
jgi:hypothetical protein